jgi:adenosylcobinamide-GDP ribazoletransferase
MIQLASAIQFLTILPLKRTAIFDPVGMVPWFPVVGLIIGAMAALLDASTTPLFPLQLRALIVVVFLAVITGGLHLDGLADTADGLFSHRSRERALEIMKDSRVGVMGVVAVWVVMASKWAALAHLTENRWLYLILVPAAARLAMMVAIALLPYGREEGTARAVYNKPLNWKSFVGGTPVLLLTLFLGPSGWIQISAWILGTALIILFYKRQMGCVTGDMLGATGEFMEAWMWFWACLTV